MAGVVRCKLGDELAGMWGIKDCRDIKIHIPLHGFATITIEFYAGPRQMDCLKDITKKYRLEEIVPKEKGEK